MPGPLSGAQLAAFKRDGFVVLPALIPARQIDAWRQQVGAAWCPTAAGVTGWLEFYSAADPPTAAVNCRE
jgi:hypothetical protein